MLGIFGMIMTINAQGRLERHPFRELLERQIGSHHSGVALTIRRALHATFKGYLAHSYFFSFLP